MPRIADPAQAVTGGVDTHAEVNVAAVVDAVGRVLGTEEFPTTAGGDQAVAGSKPSCMGSIADPAAVEQPVVQLGTAEGAGDAKMPGRPRPAASRGRPGGFTGPAPDRCS